jgi:papain like protease
MAKLARKPREGRIGSPEQAWRRPSRSGDMRRLATSLPVSTADAVGEGLNTITVGNRIFVAKPSTLSERKLDILPDMPDIRDRIYVPHLRALHSGISPRIAFTVRDQGPDSSCTGFALAHVVDFLRFREVSADAPQQVSARMLYEMAKRNDEWAGSAYEGSSIRGAIKGFFRNGVCSDATAPDSPGVKDWSLTYEMAKEARETRLGAYFRLQPDISDYHAALNDVGVIYASAQIHSNWDKQKLKNGHIEPHGEPAGGHAFAIVGYDERGFWILNSWGPDWGLKGTAHWDYSDWAATIMDAWVLQLGVRAPDAFGAVPRVTPSATTGLFGFGDPTRADIVGHFVNIDEGRLVPRRSDYDSLSCVSGMGIGRG